MASDTPAANPGPVGPYTPAVRAGDLLFVSGQLGLVDGEMAGGGVGPQLEAALVNLRSVLAGAGAVLEDIVKCTVFLVDMDDFAAMNDVYVDGFGGHRPARSTIGVAALPRGAAVEIEAIAYLGGR